MRFPPLAPLVVAVALAAACSDTTRPEGPPAPPTAGAVDAASGATAPTSTEAQSGAPTPSADGGSTPIRPTPVAFRAFVAALDGPSPALAALAADTDDDRLAGLADEVCAVIEPDMTTAELGATALGRGADLEILAPGLRPDEVTLVFGALAGLHCPERLPLSGLRLGDDPAPPAELVDGFRATVIELWPTAHPLPAYLDATTDGRIDEVATAACERASAEHTTVQFGLAVADHRTEVLTGAEATALGVDGQQELFGALVGWFCPERLPDLD
ncbi:MAG: hypothetical protein AAF962_11990 [Actinomycetota bacterium]